METKTLTDTEKIAYLAERVMQMKKCWHRPSFTCSLLDMTRACKKCNQMIPEQEFMEQEGWNPLTDWNHFRQVEEKMMEDDELWKAFLEYSFWISKEPSSMQLYMFTGLATRVDALISAHQSLYENS